MKRFTALLIAAVLIVSMLGVMTAFAASAKVSFSGPKEILAGKTYTIKYTFKVTSAAVANANIVVGGVFKKVSGGNNLFHDTTPSNTSKSYSGSVKVSVKSDAKPGEKGTITLNNSTYTYLDAEYKETEGNVSGSFSVKVVSKLSATPTPKPTSKTSSKTSKPKATPEPTEWDIAEQKVALIEDEGALSIDITKDPKLPGTVLTTLKEKKGTLTVNLGTYSCTIDGKTLGTLPDGSDSLNLTMKMEKDEKLSAAAGGHDAYQLHFSHEGQLPGKFTYSFKAQDSAPGDMLFLYYYYDKSGVVEGMQSAVVDEKGYVSFDIYHCSSYFVSKTAIADAAGADFTSEAAHAGELAEAQAANDALQTQLDETKTQLADAQTSLEAAQTQEDNPLTQDPALFEASVSGPVEKLFGVTYGALIAALLGVALLSVLLTMLLCRVGIFKKREARRNDIL